MCLCFRSKRMTVWSDFLLLLQSLLLSTRTVVTHTHTHTHTFSQQQEVWVRSLPVSWHFLSVLHCCSAEPPAGQPHIRTCIFVRTLTDWLFLKVNKRSLTAALSGLVFQFPGSVKDLRFRRVYSSHAQLYKCNLQWSLTHSLDCAYLHSWVFSLTSFISANSLSGITLLETELWSMSSGLSPFLSLLSPCVRVECRKCEKASSVDLFGR